MPDIEPDDPSSDAELLRRYRSGGDEAAFAGLVARHGGWVYASALRRVRDPHLAEDVAQAVFLALAQDGPMSGDAPMSAWLFRVTHYASSAALRSESRRRRHEAQAAREEAMPSNDDEMWDAISPHLERALDRLGRRDRTIVLLRFYERKSFRETAAALAISEVSARKRLSRAMEKLRQLFERWGIDAPADVLPTALLAHASAMAPPTLVEQLCDPAKAATPSSTVLARTATRALQRARMAPVTLASLALVLIASTSCFIARSNASRSTVVAGVATTISQKIDLSPRSIIEKIRAGERGIDHLYIGDFETTFEESNDGQHWTETEAKYAGSGWFDGSPDGRARLHLTTWVAPWAEGAAPWYESALVATWNGEEGRSVDITGGPIGNTLPQRDAMITSQPPPLLGKRHGWTHIGLGFSLQYGHGSLHNTSNTPLSEQIESFTKSGKVNVTMSEVVVNGFRAVRVHVEPPAGAFNSGNTLTYWFSTEHNFALVKVEQVTLIRNARRVEGFDVTELKQAATGLWFPTAARETRVRIVPNQPDVHVRTTFRAREVIANDKQWDDRVFNVEIPRGYIVSDRRDGQADGSHDYIIDDEGQRVPLPSGTVVPSVRTREVMLPDSSGRLR